jgi:hypothetical protein
MSSTNVTAQDFEKFKDAIIDAEVEYNRKFDEAQSMDDDDIAEKADDKWHNAIRRLYDSVRQEARREALKEMDEAYGQSAIPKTQWQSAQSHYGRHVIKILCDCAAVIPDFRTFSFYINPRRTECAIVRRTFLRVFSTQFQYQQNF